MFRKLPTGVKIITKGGYKKMNELLDFFDYPYAMADRLLREIQGMRNTSVLYQRSIHLKMDSTGAWYTIDLPGIPPSDVNVVDEDDELVINIQGDCHMVLPLVKGVDKQNVTANMENGRLTIFFPAPSKKEPKLIPITSPAEAKLITAEESQETKAEQ